MIKTKQLTWLVGILVLLLLLCITTLLALSLGEINLSPSRLYAILHEQHSIEYTIITQIRLPRVLLAFAIGGGLSLAGAILQGVYQNPLVEPYTMGISGGAALGVSIAIASGLSFYLGAFSLPLAGFIGSLVVLFLVYFLAIYKNHININKMLLIGVMISFISSSAMMLILSTTKQENINSIIFWMMGALDETNPHLIGLVTSLSLIGLLVSYLFANHLNALQLGEAKAKHLGINTALTIRILFVIASVLTGMSVAIAGIIGFVGLIIPHIIRLTLGYDYRILLLGSFLGGGVFLLLSDIIARTIISPSELPIGVITGIIGGIIFIFVLHKSSFKHA